MQYYRLRNRLRRVAAPLLGGMLLFSGLVVAADRAEIELVRQGVGKLLGGETPDSIQPSVIQGVYEVMIGPRLVYVSADGKYLLNGKLFDIETREDLTTPKVAKAKARAIEAVGEENMVIFAPEKFEHTVTVFTDIDCGYCRKLHSEIGQYNDLGIRVRYMMFPRAGVGSSSFDKAVAVWCADDRQKAMTLSKAGKQVEQKKCENPIIQHMELGQLLGVTGTPAIFFDDGELLPGYVPAKRMLSYLKAKQSQ
ncbi:DsbC family protein [Candidatus Endoriftia persephone]|uniref:Thiol:disulfide interchange protein n=3 Tax=Gammaproteobacteria TaxID=1236 RepID=G2FJX4_9GAMM|nr:DsbC family protein [Candidatus Endoriftia persephone]EGV49880.1 thiol:disulfide interchange protein DsbC [endosymbiont of Riftia pachyptila (vent Ph05)]EGW52902.1 thiol:disulfide interchange protein DsbC [endosymbiont of Tevnia jerichonana (vent Tica)]USF86992.1 DsbC family protein [Candidatus Endoriftia persephone]